MELTHDQELRDRLVEHALTGGRYGGMLRTGIVMAWRSPPESREAGR